MAIYQCRPGQGEQNNSFVGQLRRAKASFGAQIANQARRSMILMRRSVGACLRRARGRDHSFVGQLRRGKTSFSTKGFPTRRAGACFCYSVSAYKNMLPRASWLPCALKHGFDAPKLWCRNTDACLLNRAYLTEQGKRPFFWHPFFRVLELASACPHGARRSWPRCAKAIRCGMMDIFSISHGIARNLFLAKAAPPIRLHFPSPAMSRKLTTVKKKTCNVKTEAGAQLVGVKQERRERPAKDQRRIAEELNDEDMHQAKKKHKTQLAVAIHQGLVPKARRPFALFVAGAPRDADTPPGAKWKKLGQLWQAMSDEDKGKFQTKSESEFKAQRSAMFEVGLHTRTRQGHPNATGNASQPPGSIASSSSQCNVAAAIVSGKTLSSGFGGTPRAPVPADIGPLLMPGVKSETDEEVRFQLAGSFWCPAHWVVVQVRIDRVSFESSLVDAHLLCGPMCRALTNRNQPGPGQLGPKNQSRG
jgi:hypothetical protein